MKIVGYIFLILISFCLACPPSNQSLVTRVETKDNTGIISIDLIFPSEIDTIKNRRILTKIWMGTEILQTHSFMISDSYNTELSLFNIQLGENQLVEVFVYDAATHFFEMYGFNRVTVRSGEESKIKIDLTKKSVNNFCNGVVATNLIFSKKDSEIEANDSVN